MTIIAVKINRQSQKRNVIMFMVIGHERKYLESQKVIPTPRKNIALFVEKK